MARFLIASIAIAVAGVLCATARPLRSSTSQVGTAGDYDLYALAMIWEPEACESQSYPECHDVKPGSYAESNFTLHGLWPQYKSSRSGHDWPQYCGKNNGSSTWQMLATVSNAVKNEFEDTWEEYAPAYDYSLASHEWEKHGTCFSSRMHDVKSSSDVASAQESFFGYGIKLLQQVGTPISFVYAQTTKKPIAMQQVISDLGGEGYVTISCIHDKGNDGYYINQVSVCFDHNDGVPTNRVRCPDNMLNNSYDNNCILDGVEEVYIR